MSDSPVDDLAQALACDQDARLADSSRRHAAMKSALLADPRVTDSPPASSWRAAALALAAAVLLMVGAGVWLSLRADASLTFTIGDDRIARAQAPWIAAPTAPVPVKFSNGSHLVLVRGSRARVHTTQGDGARIVLESGGAAFDTTVTSGAKVPMIVTAGPFEVELDASACDVTWDGATDTLGIVVHGGRVHVTGPDDQSHDVAAGQRIDLSRLDAVAGAPAAPAADAGPQHDPAPAVVEPEPSPSAGAKRPRRATVPDWSALARASKHKEALAAAEAAGFGPLCESLGPAALLRLADAARFAGNRKRAGQALKALRRRHRKSGEAAVAAYTLGRIAAGDRRHAEAAELFTTYLRERPRGSLAREALGRRLEAEAAAGWTARADATARRYLELYPRGPHADLAAARSQ